MLRSSAPHRSSRAAFRFYLPSATRRCCVWHAFGCLSARVKKQRPTPHQKALKTNMLFTRCTACAAPLPEDAVRCAACATGYCSERCERYDRRRGGHGKICGAIASGGGAEQYQADKKYEEAVTVAVEECAEDTAGQTCYICLEDGSEEGLVRMCACRGASGFAHVSCLARQVQVLVADAEERDLDDDAFNARWLRWDMCRLCEQDYHGVVMCALGWACWKTYLGRPEADWARRMAMNQLANGLAVAEYHEDSLSVREAELATEERLGASPLRTLVTRGNLALSYYHLGRIEDALRLQREVYTGWQILSVSSEVLSSSALREAVGDCLTISVGNLTELLVAAREFEEAQSLAREKLPAIIDRHGPDHTLTLEVRTWYARALFLEGEELSAAENVLEDVWRRSKRVFSDSHPDTERARKFLEDVRSARADAAEES